MFRTPQVILFSPNLPRAVAFYASLGFSESFRVPAEGEPIHVDLTLDGYKIGIASVASTRNDHGLDPVPEGQRAAVILDRRHRRRFCEADRAVEPRRWHPRTSGLGVCSSHGFLIQTAIQSRSRKFSKATPPAALCGHGARRAPWRDSDPSGKPIVARETFSRR